MNDISKGLTDAWLLRYTARGRVVGFRASEVKHDGVFSLIGLQNGNILLTINDYDINSPEKGVPLLSGLRGESNVSVMLLGTVSQRSCNIIPDKVAI